MPLRQKHSARSRNENGYVIQLAKADGLTSSCGTTEGTEPFLALLLW